MSYSIVRGTVRTDSSRIQLYVCTSLSTDYCTASLVAEPGRLGRGDGEQTRHTRQQRAQLKATNCGLIRLKHLYCITYQHSAASVHENWDL